MANRNSEVPSSEDERGLYISIITPKIYIFIITLKNIYLYHNAEKYISPPSSKIKEAFGENITQNIQVLKDSDRKACIAELKNHTIKTMFTPNYFYDL